MLNAGGFVACRAVVFGNLGFDDDLEMELVGDDEIGRLVEARDAFGAFGLSITHSVARENFLANEFAVGVATPGESCGRGHAPRWRCGRLWIVVCQRLCEENRSAAQRFVDAVDAAIELLAARTPSARRPGFARRARGLRRRFSNCSTKAMKLRDRDHPYRQMLDVAGHRELLRSARVYARHPRRREIVGDKIMSET
jgi:hypothetical protein